jgi:hypothetical protein
MENNEMNLWQRLHAITNEIETVAKNLNVGTGGNNSYKGVAEADVLRAIKPLEFKYGVYSYPASRTIHHQEVFRWEEKYGTKINQKKQFVMRTEVTYRFVNIDKPEEFLEVTSYGDGIDSGDKAPGKAQTYADKFAILKAYKMVTGEDPESRHSDDIVVPPNTIVLDKIKELLGNDVPRIQSVLDYYNVKSLDELDMIQQQQCYKQVKKKEVK